MVDCLSFLTVGSTDPSPTQTCCGGIKTVLEYSPKCLCSALESSRDMGFVLDDNKALALPKICNVPIDPHCDVSTLSASTPISSPVEPPTTSPPSSTKSPAIIRSPPPVSHSSPPVGHSSPPVSHSSPAREVSSSTMTASSPAATSPSPSPSVSSTGILSVSKLVLAVVIVSSFDFNVVHQCCTHDLSSRAIGEGPRPDASNGPGICYWSAHRARRKEESAETLRVGQLAARARSKILAFKRIN
ncbi:PREDICTED: non-specific lipid-transfer protein-like protein At2g13820 [Camelina sativa]|uniref:Non-specific lipid-transfer protein-like protein At2g13820 n=1 Tax=Camelina sativa TaxID=90675 RepID=A0ABM0ZBU0_CAMSA|nr:PREDICTED: non-specific lipid-transfer protein-like protein At2g13820 [Camelina sativa]